MPSTGQKLDQFGEDAYKVSSYISLRRSLLAVGGIQMIIGIVLLTAGIILGFPIAGFVTVSVVTILGIIGLVAGFICQPIEAPFVLARRVRRIKVVAGAYMFVLVTVFVIAGITLGWEFWEMAEINRARMERKSAALLHYPFSNAILVVACATSILITLIPMCAFGLDLSAMSKSKMPSHLEA